MRFQDLRKHFKSLLAFALLALIVGALLYLDVVQSSERQARPVDNPIWKARHDVFKYQAKNMPINVLFIGDSITQGWETVGYHLWQKYYAPLGSANFGISGDRWENVLWRLNHGELKGIHARVAVLLIGTNNVSAGDDPADTAAGIAQIVAVIREKLPSTRIILLGILPRDHYPGTEYRKKIALINKRISTLNDGYRIIYQDISSHFLDGEGKVPYDVMPDELHLSEKGYEIWARAMNSTLFHLFQSQG